MRAIRTIFFAIVLPIVVGGCTILEPDVELYDDVDAEIAREVEANDIPSVAAWVAKDDEIVWERYYGFADRFSRRPADQHTIYGLASVSKLAVVTAVMQLVERGQLGLDDDVNDYLSFSVRNPRYPNDKITPRHLLTHSSGLAWPVDHATVPGYYEQFPNDSSPPLELWIPQFVDPAGRHYVDAVWKDGRPGEKELYSNIGVSLLAHLVEAVTGRKFNEYCKQNIFGPLGMDNTSFAYADLDAEHLATLYDTVLRTVPFNRGRGWPSGDLKSTIADFSRFMIAYMNGGEYDGMRILESATVEEILKMRNPASGLCFIWNRTLNDWYGHAGGKEGVSAYVEFQRDSNVALMVVSNQWTNPLYPGKKIHALVRRVAAEYQ